MLLNVAHQQHVRIRIFPPVVYQLQHIVEMRLQLLTCFELKIGGKEVVYI